MAKKSKPPRLILNCNPGHWHGAVAAAMHHLNYERNQHRQQKQMAVRLSSGTVYFIYRNKGNSLSVWSGK